MERLPCGEHAVLDGGLKELGGVGYPYFFHHIGSVSLYRFYADFEALSDFFILHSRPDQLEDFVFAACEGFRSFPARRGGWPSGVTPGWFLGAG